MEFTEIEIKFNGLPEEVKEKYYQRVTETLDGFLWCNRVWEAWYIGTMSESDFIPAGEDPDVIHEHAVKMYGLFLELMN